MVIMDTEKQNVLFASFLGLREVISFIIGLVLEKLSLKLMKVKPEMFRVNMLYC